MKISLIISLMRDLTWYSSVWVFLAFGSREKDVNSLSTGHPAPQAACQEAQVTCPVSCRYIFFFLVFFKAAAVGLSAWCSWIVTLLVLWVMNSKHCLAADAIFLGTGLPPLSGPSMFYDTTLPCRTCRSGGIRTRSSPGSWACSLTLSPQSSVPTTCPRATPT